jgi:hypothetical protein
MNGGELFRDARGKHIQARKDTNACSVTQCSEAWMV